MAHASVCDVSGATSPSCKVTRANWNVHDQPESFRTRPAAVNLIRLVEFKTIPQPRMLDAWHQWCNTGRVFVTRDFSAIFGHLFDRVPIRRLTSDFHHWALRKKAYKVRGYDFGVHLPLRQICLKIGLCRETLSHEMHQGVPFHFLISSPNGLSTIFLGRLLCCQIKLKFAHLHEITNNYCRTPAAARLAVDVRIGASHAAILDCLHCLHYLGSRRSEEKVRDRQVYVLHVMLGPFLSRGDMTHTHKHTHN